LKSLPLFHKIAGEPVIVIGEGPAADAKHRLVEGAGGQVVTDIQAGIERGARLAFVVIDDLHQAESAVMRLHRAGVLVNVADRPALCGFTTPSILDRDPVQVAIGTEGFSAALAKQLRLRLEALLPEGLGLLAQALAAAREEMRKRWPDAGDRRRALDAALQQGGVLDPFEDHGVLAVSNWLKGEERRAGPRRIEFTVESESPDDLTLRQLQLLGAADAILYEAGVPVTILDRARADARRMRLPYDGDLPDGLIVVLYRGF
jgi:uroporphyrin-III C-methyltransferase/precorrin-2 dehydrogenase/sirohydrochlorin ferrochelatase